VNQHRLARRELAQRKEGLIGRKENFWYRGGFDFPGEFQPEDSRFTERWWILSPPLQYIGAIQGCGSHPNQ
jgi:hypothetical protein